jgi:hypothetical protein
MKTFQKLFSPLVCARTYVRALPFPQSLCENVRSSAAADLSDSDIRYEAAVRGNTAEILKATAKSKQAICELRREPVAQAFPSRSGENVRSSKATWNAKETALRCQQENDHETSRDMFRWQEDHFPKVPISFGDDFFKVGEDDTEGILPAFSSLHIGTHRAHSSDSSHSSENVRSSSLTFRVHREEARTSSHSHCTPRQRVLRRLCTNFWRSLFLLTMETPLEISSCSMAFI